MTEVITSASNPKIKRLLALQQKSSARREAGLFVVEGRRELRHCLDAGFEIDTIFHCPGLLSTPPGGWVPPVHEATGGYGSSAAPARKPFSSEAVTAPGNRATLGTVRGGTASEAQRWGRAKRDVSGGSSPRRNSEKVFAVSGDVYRKIAMREGTEGVIADVRIPERRLEDLSLPENPLVMVLESVEKPGNLGAVLRSADAAGADAVLCCDPLTDLWNPNLIRASVGAVFTVPCVCCGSEEAIAFLKARGIRILTAQLQDSSLYYDCGMTGGTALVMGTEATGLTPQWREAADAHIRIPMLGALDSLNVSVSAAILLFEAVRQRQNTRNDG